MLIECCIMNAVRCGPCGLFILLHIHNNLAAPTYTDSDSQNPQQTLTRNAVAPFVPPYPFRKDLFTEEECILYFSLAAKRSMCLLTPGDSVCTIIEESPRRSQMLNTYVEIACLHRPRSLLVKTTQRVSQISPQRAVVLYLTEVPGKEDLLTVDVVGPIRNQTVHIGMFGCYSPNTTARVYELGVIPNLHSFAFYSCFSLAIHKFEFTHMPQLRQIVFSLSTISTLEPGTFTDLPNLRTLILEKSWIVELFGASTPSSSNNYSASVNDLDYLHNLHCDCSFAWLRRFLKQKPYLIEAKEPGEVFRVGNYFSAAVKRNGNDTNVFSVDCLKNVTLENIWTGNQFSYNEHCSDDIC
ncbi:uncharacterized protein LOC129580843 [Paramacrobiotus metropolitanus]|uniref:uncharacterized protein LOC129580843 n=1 Tax=Paramacrobiotus metropolitanus TaxID=2943436 RepID=UPI00244579C3|nr:uncharacterized protein LOC129580843 [Paramacrobiotus metropolitanus]